MVAAGVTVVLLCCIVVSSCNVAGTKATHGKLFVCYWGSWSHYRPGGGKFSVDDVNPHLCTHLVYAFSKLENGVITAFDPWLDLEDYFGLGTYKKFNALKRVNPKLKTLIAIGGWNEGSTKYSEMASTDQRRQKFAQSVVAFLDRHGFDGLDMDWEYPTRRGGKETDRDNFVLLLRALRDVLKPKNYLLAAAVSAGKPTIDSAYNVTEMMECLDVVSVMGYDYFGAWEKTTGHNSPLRARENASELETIFNIESSIDQWIDEGADRRKLVLGMPIYGRSFTLADPSQSGFMAPVKGPGPKGPFTGESGFLGYNEICEMLQSSGGWTMTRQPNVSAPVAVKDGVWIGFDDVQSLQNKVQFAMSKQLAGAMVWSVETDDFRGVCGNGKNPLLNAIRRSLDLPPVERPEASKPSPRPTQFSSPKRPAAFPVLGTGNPSVTKSSTLSLSISSPRPTSWSTGSPKQPERSTDSQHEAENPDHLSCKVRGLQAHPDSRHKFYSCAKNRNGGYTAHVFNCPSGTIFDRKTDVCVHELSLPKVPAAAKERLEVMAVESTAGAPLHQHGVSKKTSRSPETVFVLRSTAPDVVTYSLKETGEKATSRDATDDRPRVLVVTATVAEGPKEHQKVTRVPKRPSERDQCLKSGYHAGLLNKFHRTVLGPYGGYKVYDFVCPGKTFFDADLCTCVSVDFQST